MKSLILISLVALGLPLLVAASASAQEIRGADAWVEAKQNANGQTRLVIGLSAPSSTPASLEIAFGTGVPGDESQVSPAEPSVVENKLFLNATRAVQGIDEKMEIAIVDDRVVRIAFPALAPKRPDIAFSFNLAKLKYTRAFNGTNTTVAEKETPGRYITRRAEAGYWIFYGSNEYPPLIVTGFSPGRTTYLFNDDGLFTAFYNSDLTAAISFLNVQAAPETDAEGLLTKAAEEFMSKSEYLNP